MTFSSTCSRTAGSSVAAAALIIDLQTALLPLTQMEKVYQAQRPEVEWKGRSASSFHEALHTFDFWFDSRLVWRRWLIVLIWKAHLQLQRCCVWNTCRYTSSLKSDASDLLPRFDLSCFDFCGKILEKYQESWTYLGFHTKSKTKEPAWEYLVTVLHYMSHVSVLYYKTASLL